MYAAFYHIAQHTVSPTSDGWTEQHMTPFTKLPYISVCSPMKEGHYALLEAVASFCTANQLRFLFACVSRVILEGYPALPLWEELRLHLAQDFIADTGSEERGSDHALQSLSEYVGDGGRTLADFGLPQPLFRTPEVVAEEETYASHLGDLLQRAHHKYQTMNPEQKHVYTTIVGTVHAYAEDANHYSHPFFVEGKPGRGKTFIMDAISSLLRGQTLIVLIVGSSALAATLYEGGRTAHNLFQIPVTEVRPLHSFIFALTSLPNERTTYCLNPPYALFLIVPTSLGPVHSSYGMNFPPQM